ncbi:MAG: c-type cytochrome [Ginsengibacter sp.]
MKRRFTVVMLVIIIIALSIFIEYEAGRKKINKQPGPTTTSINKEIGIDSSQIPPTPEGELIKYGRSLITNTSFYFGPSGIIQKIGNGMNCQNCHLEAGTKPYGNNFYLVATGYPRYKDRSGAMETVQRKVEDCFERSMNGESIDSNGREMKAFIAYLNWVGSNVTYDKKPAGTGLQELLFMDRAADTSKGRIVFINKCQVCHGKNGEGQMLADSSGKIYPPLWGANSYNIGASIYRISKMASFVKDNMPFGASHNAPQLINEEAWDVAAFVNTQYHPRKNISGDWPVLNKKPYDYPFGPYAEKQFSEKDHKYGPFASIKDYYSGKGKK